MEKWDQTESSEIPDRGETSEIPGLPSGIQVRNPGSSRNNSTVVGVRTAWVITKKNREAGLTKINSLPLRQLDLDLLFVDVEHRWCWCSVGLV